MNFNRAGVPDDPKFRLADRILRSMFPGKKRDSKPLTPLLKNIMKSGHEAPVDLACAVYLSSQLASLPPATSLDDCRDRILQDLGPAIEAMTWDHLSTVYLNYEDAEFESKAVELTVLAKLLQDVEQFDKDLRADTLDDHLKFYYRDLLALQKKFKPHEDSKSPLASQLRQDFSRLLSQIHQRTNAAFANSKLPQDHRPLRAAFMYMTAMGSQAPDEARFGLSVAQRLISYNVPNAQAAASAVIAYASCKPDEAPDMASDLNCCLREVLGPQIHGLFTQLVNNHDRLSGPSPEIGTIDETSTLQKIVMLAGAEQDAKQIALFAADHRQAPATAAELASAQRAFSRAAEVYTLYRGVNKDFAADLDSALRRSCLAIMKLEAGRALADCCLAPGQRPN